jgi:hypothetical protein
MEINLDGMSIDELRAFWDKWHRTTSMRAYEVLPIKHARDAMESLAAYAMDKQLAMRNRLEGKIETALYFERNCELRYNNLPQEVKW